MTEKPTRYDYNWLRLTGFYYLHYPKRGWFYAELWVAHNAVGAIAWWDTGVRAGVI